MEQDKDSECSSHVDPCEDVCIGDIKGDEEIKCPQDNSNQNNMSSLDVPCDNFSSFTSNNLASSGALSGCYRYHPSNLSRPWCKVGGSSIGDILGTAESFERVPQIPDWDKLKTMVRSNKKIEERGVNSGDGERKCHIDRLDETISAGAPAISAGAPIAIAENTNDDRLPCDNSEEMEVDNTENEGDKRLRLKTKEFSRSKKSRSQKQSKKAQKNSKKYNKKTQKVDQDSPRSLRKRRYSKSFPSGIEDYDDDAILYRLATPNEIPHRGKHSYNFNTNNSNKAKLRTKNARSVRKIKRSANLNTNCNRCLKKKAQARTRQSSATLDGSRGYCSLRRQRCNRSRSSNSNKDSTKSRLRKFCKMKNINKTEDSSPVSNGDGNSNANSNNSCLPNNSSNSGCSNGKDGNWNTSSPDNKSSHKILSGQEERNPAIIACNNDGSVNYDVACSNFNVNNNSNSRIRNMNRKAANRNVRSRSSLRSIQSDSRKARLAKMRAKKLLLEKYSKIRDVKGVKMKSLVHAKFLMPNKSKLKPLNLPGRYGMVVEEKVKESPKKRRNTRGSRRSSAKKSRATSKKPRANGLSRKLNKGPAKGKSKSACKSLKSRYDMRPRKRVENVHISDSGHGEKNSLEVRSKNEKRDKKYESATSNTGGNPSTEFLTLANNGSRTFKERKYSSANRGRTNSKKTRALKSNSRRSSALSRSEEINGQDQLESGTRLDGSLGRKGRKKQALNKNETGAPASTDSNTNVNSNLPDRPSEPNDEVFPRRCRSPPKKKRRCKTKRGKAGKTSSRVRFYKKKIVHSYNRC